MTFMLLMCIFLTGNAQHEIKVELDNYTQDTIVLGYFFGDKQLVKDTIYAEAPGQFLIKGDDNLDPGVYLILLFPSKEYFQFLVNENEQRFTIRGNMDDMSKMTYEGSPDNTLFQDYLDFLAEKRPLLEQYQETINRQRDAGQSTTETGGQLKALNDEVMARQEDIVTNHPGTMTALLVNANREIDVPDFADAEDPTVARYIYYKKRYFDNVDFKNPAVLLTPFLFKKIEYYIEKLTPNHPDSIARSIDVVLEKTKPVDQTFQFYLSHFLNTYAKSKIVGYDAVYVHLIDNYYARGLAPWVSEENLEKIVDNANKIRPTLIGKTGANLQVYLEDGTPIKISDIDYEYLVLLFWAPDCGHCKKTMPDFVAFNEQWMDKGVKVLAICTKHQDKTETCWDVLEEKNMTGFINAADQYHRSRFKVHYNVNSTPKVYILDKNREILIKGIAGEQLNVVMEEIIKRRSSEF